MTNAKTLVLLAVIAVSANAAVLEGLLGGGSGGAGGLGGLGGIVGGLPLVGPVLGGVLGGNGGLGGLVGGLPIVGGLVPTLLGTVDNLLTTVLALVTGPLGVVGGAGGDATQVLTQVIPNLQCLSPQALKEQCGALNVLTRCEATDCKGTPVCVDVCLGIKLVDSLVGVLTGQCICQDGFYKSKQGTCVSLQTCLDVNLNASGRKKRALLGLDAGANAGANAGASTGVLDGVLGGNGGLGGIVGGLPLVGPVLGGVLGGNGGLGGLVGGLPIVGGLVPTLLGTVDQLLTTVLAALGGPLAIAGQAGGATQVLTQAIPNLQCLTPQEMKEQCGLLNVKTRCEATDCKGTQVCADVCLGIKLVDSIVGVLTGQCICQDGFYKTKQGTCVSLQTCVDVNLNASG